jgi:hypothetical protein
MQRNSKGDVQGHKGVCDPFVSFFIFLGKDLVVWLKITIIAETVIEGQKKCKNILNRRKTRIYLVL